MKHHLAINGVCGRMGQRILHLAIADGGFSVVAGLEGAGHPQIGKDLGACSGLPVMGLHVQSSLPPGTRCDVVIDFSSPAGTASILPECVARRIPILIATTGHSHEQRQAIESAAHETAVLLAPNTSLAVNLLMKLVVEAAKALKGRGFDVEILERHHRFKKDSPSGTALHIAKSIQEVMALPTMKHGREGVVGERTDQEIGVHAIRVGDNVGEHTIVFGTLGETLELTHRAQTRDCYASGALQAAKYLANRPAGRYSMSDVLGL